MLSIQNTTYAQELQTKLNYCSEVVSLKEEQEVGILERQTKKIKKNKAQSHVM